MCGQPIVMHDAALLCARVLYARYGGGRTCTTDQRASSTLIFCSRSAIIMHSTWSPHCKSSLVLSLSLGTKYNMRMHVSLSGHNWGQAESEWRDSMCPPLDAGQLCNFGFREGGWRSGDPVSLLTPKNRITWPKGYTYMFCFKLQLIVWPCDFKEMF